MPAQRLVLAQVAGDAGFEMTAGGAGVDILPGGKNKPPEAAHLHLHRRRHPEMELIGL